MSITVNVSGQMPADLDLSSYRPAWAHDPNTGLSGFEIANLVKKVLIDNIAVPSNPPHPVSITDSKGNAHTIEEFSEIVAVSMFPDVGTPDHLTAAISGLTQMTLSIPMDTTMNTRQIMLAQSLGRHKLPEPSNRVRYDAGIDVIPAAKEYLAALGNTSSPTWAADSATAFDKVFASIGATWSPSTMGVGFADQATFRLFLEHLDGVVAGWSANGHLTPEVSTRVADFRNIAFDDYTEGLILRREDDPTGDYSFARLLHSALFTFAADVQAKVAAGSGAMTMGMMHFDIAKSLMPDTVVMINIDAHARATARDLSDHWREVISDLGQKVIFMPLSGLAKLNAVRKTQLSIKQAAVSMKGPKKPIERSSISFDDLADAPPSKARVVKEIKTILNHMGKVQKSANVKRTTRKTRTRASRRHPGNPNALGKSRRTTYMPDIHIYGDFSASMSLGDSIDTVMLAAGLAQRLGVDFYFSSFSHGLSQETLVPVKGRSIKQIVRYVEQIPKVGGGTDFEPIYKYINANPERRLRLNIISTDFGWWAPAHKLEHSPNTIYVPAFDHADPNAWNIIKDQAVNFCHSVYANPGKIRPTLVGMKK